MALRFLARRRLPEAAVVRRPFELLLFSTDTALIRETVAAGVTGVVVDWERAGKAERQAGTDTQINLDSADDLSRVRASTSVIVICRINGYGPATRAEVENAIERGANEIFLPMVRKLEDVEAVLAQVRGRCGVGILIETIAAVALAECLAALPLSRVYVGLNDLSIDRGSPNIFEALLDGTVERVRERFSIPFGFGGLTLPECGDPIPCRLLIAETARLDCGFGVARRSFLRDIRGRDVSREIPRLLRAVDEARSRSPERVALDRRELVETIRAWSGASARAGAARV